MPEFLDDDGIRIAYYEWPVLEPRAAIQIVHGLGDHAGRYAWLAEQLNRAGYSVYANDQRGHGRTGLDQHAGDTARLGRLGPGGLRAAERAVTMFTGIVRRREPGVPLVLLGHSWGALMAQRILNRFPRDYDAVVLTGTGMRLPGLLNSGDLNARHRHLGTTGYEWLSRDPEVADAFAADPWTFPAKVLPLFGLADGVRLFGRPARDLPPTLPLLVMIGEEDSLAGERSAVALVNSYLSRSGLEDVELIVYAGARHEVFNEVNKEEVVSDLVDWLGAHVPAAARTGSGGDA